MSEPRLRVAVIYGGTSSEHPISCVSAGSVLRSIDDDRFDVVRVGIDRQGTWRLDDQDISRLGLGSELPEVLGGDVIALNMDRTRRGLIIDGHLLPVDVAFPVLHGPFGEDGAIQGLLEVAGIPYVGSGVFASALAMDKGHFKSYLSAMGVEVGRFVSFDLRQWRQDPHGVRGQIAELGLPVFVKPSRAGSSQGISKVSGEQGLDAAIEEAVRHDPRVIVEAGLVDVREIEIGVLGTRDPRTSACGEIRVREGHEFYDFEAKYLDDSVDLIVGTELPEHVRAEIEQVAVQAFTALGCEGLARVDFFVRADGIVILNEINTMPGFTSASMYPAMWQASGVSYDQIVATLIDDALEKGVGLR